MMKKVTLIFLLTFLVSVVYSQDENPAKQKKVKKAAKTETDQRNHVATVNVLAIPLGKLSLDYQYRVSEKAALGLNVGIPLESSIPDDVSGEIDEINVNSSSFQGFSIRPHYRLFSGKRGAPRGFYIEPYLKYQEYEAQVDGQYDDMGVFRTGEGEFDLQGFGGGFQMGSQFLISNRVALDLGFFGLDFTNSDLNFRFTDTSGGPTAYLDDLRMDLDESIADLPLGLDDKITSSGGSAEGYVEATGDGVWVPGYRFVIGLGVSF